MSTSSYALRPSSNAQKLANNLISTEVSIYQSNGACFQQCLDDYAFAVVQGKTCWCSNYIPASQEPIGQCQNNCPGFPSDKCGGNDLFGYIALSKSPSGTLGASTASATSEPASSTSQPPSTEPTSQPVSAFQFPSICAMCTIVICFYKYCGPLLPSEQSIQSCSSPILQSAIPTYETRLSHHVPINLKHN